MEHSGAEPERLGPSDEEKSTGRVLCEKMKRKALGPGYSSKVDEIRQAMDDLGCPTPDSFFACAPCKTQSKSGFNVIDDPEHAKVLLCENWIEKYRLGQSTVTKSLIHELIHAYDQCRAKVDWDDCLHLACSEVRAAHLSGDCSFREEFDRSMFAFKGQGWKCIKRRAEVSVSGQEKCKDIAKLAVDKVFDHCIKDYAPFIGKQ